MKVKVLVIILKFSIYDIRKISQLPNQKKQELLLDGVVPADLNGYALVLTKKLVIISSEDRLHIDLF